MFFIDDSPVIEEKPRKNYDELDSELIKKLQNNEINVDEVVKNLEKLYKGSKYNINHNFDYENKNKF